MSEFWCISMHVFHQAHLDHFHCSAVGGEVIPLPSQVWCGIHGTRVLMSRLVEDLRLSVLLIPGYLVCPGVPFGKTNRRYLLAVSLPSYFLDMNPCVCGRWCYVRFDTFLPWVVVTSVLGTVSLVMLEWCWFNFYPSGKTCPAFRFLCNTMPPRMVGLFSVSVF